jgi:hypothetical protein
MKAAALLVLGACFALVLTVPDVASAQRARSCNARAIRAASEKQVTPRLVGCRYDDVAVPLAQYFAIYPSLTKTPGAQANSTILEQSPAAGEPLAAGGQLALNVSIGLPAKPAQTEAPPVTAAGMAPAETVSAFQPEVPVGVASPNSIATPAATMASVSEPVAIAPVSETDAVPTAPAAPSPKKFSISYLVRPGLIWVWLAIAVALGGILFLAFRRQNPRTDAGYERVPQVTARFRFGPGRLNVSGPLVVTTEAQI